jgi:NADPH:quinone reductase-like Zn-dependent oxidoreductase
MSTTKQAILTPGAGIDSLGWESRELTGLAPNEVRVRVQAASLNYRDLMIAWGKYPVGGRTKVVPLSDGAGVVEEVGDGVTRVRKGDRVVANFMRDWVSGSITPAAKASALGGEAEGMLAESVVLPEHALAIIPQSLTFTEAASIPCAGVTAWNALQVTGTVRPGDRVVVQGTGGVSVFALQIAKASGAHVLVTTGKDSKGEQLRSLGADEIVNYKAKPDWASAATAWTGGQGADHVVEVGGAGTFAQSMQAVRMGGTVSVIGVLTGTEAPVSLIPFLHKHTVVNGIFVGSRVMLEDLMRTGIKPVIDRVFPFGEAREAYRYLESGAHLGKVVLEAA